MEHRCGHRRAATIPVTVRTRDGLVVGGTLIDISASGAFVRSRRPLRQHALVSLQFHGKEGLLSRRAVNAEVVRDSASGFALEWTVFSPPAVQSVLRYLGRLQLENGLQVD